MHLSFNFDLHNLQIIKLPNSLLHMFVTHLYFLFFFKYFEKCSFLSFFFFYHSAFHIKFWDRICFKCFIFFYLSCIAMYLFGCWILCTYLILWPNVPSIFICTVIFVNILIHICLYIATFVNIESLDVY